MLILIAGPYRSGTNVHTPIIGEWLVLPLVGLAGSRKVGDEAFNEVFHPIAIRLLQKCDAVLRVGDLRPGGTKW